MRRCKIAILFSVIAAALMISVVGYLLFLGIEESRKSYCYNSARSIGLSLANYRDGNNGCMPPLYFKDKATGERHSWRVLMLPNVAYAHVYGQYNFHESWNSAKNQEVAKLVANYACTTHLNSYEITNYVAVVGKKTLWQKPKTPDDIEYHTVSSANRTDVERDFLWPNARGAKVPRNCFSKIVIVEVVQSDIPWMEPRDITLDEFLGEITENPKGRFYNKYIDGIRAIDAAGRITVIDPYDDITKIRSLFKIPDEDKGEIVDEK
ncbi:MAG: DUF1559 domain-containing protein [Pirellulales bacterium]|nr:DUF1559 domain-containing protein [Pirellulales bacterium]